MSRVLPKSVLDAWKKRLSEKDFDKLLLNFMSVSNQKPMKGASLDTLVGRAIEITFHMKDNKLTPKDKKLSKDLTTPLKNLGHNSRPRPKHTNVDGLGDFKGAVAAEDWAAKGDSNLGTETESEEDITKHAQILEEEITETVKKIKFFKERKNSGLEFKGGPDPDRPPPFEDATLKQFLSLQEAKKKKSITPQEYNEALESLMDNIYMFVFDMGI